MTSPVYRSLRQLHTDLRQRNLSATELYGAVCDRQTQLEPTLDAYKTWAPGLAQAQASAADQALEAGADCGLLQGIPVSVKDHFGVAELPVFAGTAQALPAKFRQQGPIINHLRQQLAVIPGKTHAVELAFGGVGLNKHWGTPRNPWGAEHHRVPGGSSSGAGVSLWQGTASLALGTDTGGSVRIPASMTGTVGLKMTAKRWSTQGIVPLSSTLDTPGILARSVDDIIFGFAALDPYWPDLEALEAALPELQAADLKLGVAEGILWDQCDSQIVRVVKSALDELSRAGATVQSMNLPEAVEAQHLLRQGSVAAAECDAFVTSELPEWRTLLDPIVTSRIADGDTLSAREYIQRQQRLQQLARIAEQQLKPWHVIIAPTVPISPPRLDEVDTLEGYRPRNFAVLSNTCVANFLGLCALSIPAGLDEFGLPVGLMLMARANQEELLLAVARCIEQVLGTPQHRLGRPPLITTGAK